MSTARFSSEFFWSALPRRAHSSFPPTSSLVRHEGEGPTPAGRLRVSDNKVRLETPELADGFFLIDGATPSAYFVRPAARIFMQARQSSRLTRVFVPVDPANPCRQWQVMAKLARNCASTGRLALRTWRRGDDRRARHHSLSRGLGFGQQFSGWIDPARKFPLRIKMEDGAIVTAENIRDEAQPAQLFEMPAGLRRFDPRALIEQIKQAMSGLTGRPTSREPIPKFSSFRIPATN